jgi:hypothetical protein
MLYTKMVFPLACRRNTVLHIPWCQPYSDFSLPEMLYNKFVLCKLSKHIYLINTLLIYYRSNSKLIRYEIPYFLPPPPPLWSFTSGSDWTILSKSHKAKVTQGAQLSAYRKETGRGQWSSLIHLWQYNPFFSASHYVLVSCYPILLSLYVSNFR